jgi:hypothetical protein
MNRRDFLLSLLTLLASLSASAMSATWSGTPAGRFSREPLERSSRTAAEWPAARIASTMWLPMKPAPPVTRIFMDASEGSREKERTGAAPGNRLPIPPGRGFSGSGSIPAA